MQTGFVYDFGCQNHTFQPRKVKFCLHHPNTVHRRIKCNSNSTGVSTGSITRPLCFIAATVYWLLNGSATKPIGGQNVFAAKK
jgi:hypothetical protein